jgi:uncharacterized protein YceK
MSAAAIVGTVGTATRPVLAGCSSVVQRAAQRQQDSSWRAIGAWQERHRRDKCRWSMAQRPVAPVAVVAVPPLRDAVCGRVGEACHCGGYAPAMYLSPRRALITRRPKRATGFRRGDDADAGDRVVAPVSSRTEGGSIPAAGDAGGAVAGSLCI